MFFSTSHCSVMITGSNVTFPGFLSHVSCTSCPEPWTLLRRHDKPSDSQLSSSYNQRTPQVERRHIQSCWTKTDATEEKVGKNRLK